MKNQLLLILMGISFHLGAQSTNPLQQLLDQHPQYFKNIIEQAEKFQVPNHLYSN